MATNQLIVIVGGGFGGVTVLDKLQNRFLTDVSLDITMISNYLLFTPMLHEITSDMIETGHIMTPIRIFCKSVEVESIDLENKTSSYKGLTYPVRL